jgi:hypothetical protein
MYNEMSNLDKLEIARVLSAVCEDLRETHLAALTTARIDSDGHSALTELSLNGYDFPCLTCGHINEAEYMVAELEA